jgi:predicted transcriptional regulator
MARISLEVPEDLARRLSEQARACGISQEDALLRALRGGLDGADALEAWIAEGEADVAEGRTVSLDEVMASAQAIIAEARAKTRA